MILQIWEKYSRLPMGSHIFGLFIKRFVPYSGSIRPLVRELRPGRAVVELRDRRAVRNHLNSIHAVALMNLSELSSGMAVVSGLPDSMRGILAGFSIEFLKKARGTLTATCEHPIRESQEKREEEVVVEVKDATGTVVCRARAKWVIGPK